MTNNEKLQDCIRRLESIFLFKDRYGVISVSATDEIAFTLTHLRDVIASTQNKEQ